MLVDEFLDLILHSESQWEQLKYAGVCLHQVISTILVWVSGTITDLTEEACSDEFPMAD